MRWTTPVPEVIPDYTKKVEEKFLLFPLGLPNRTTGGTDWRWLETARVEYEWYPGAIRYWRPLRFVDE
jgi:hypothetical protein